MAVTEADIIISLGILTQVGSIQTEEEHEADPEENTDADISYLEFSELYAMAEEELGNDLTRLRLTLTLLGDVSAKRCITYLIADYSLTCQPNWDAAKMNFNQDTSLYQFANRQGSSYFTNYLRTIDNALRADPDYIARKAGVLIT
ncbi:MAG: hypothetical protein NTV15_08825 [Candidatus Bathyarchaeota archaeon]|nr:hypothetical protein [Candidatus Bathyarchaeota archaeon]